MVLYKMKKTGSEKPTQQKTVTATTSPVVVIPDDGYELRKVTVNPQAHSASKYIAESDPAYDLGAHHNVRYIDTTGIRLRRTLLWENPNPTSNFAAQAVSLNHFTNLNDYDYYLIVYKANTAAGDTEIEAMLTPDVLSNNDTRRGAFAVKSSSWYIRMIYLVSNTTTMQITTAYQPSSTNTSTSKCIPLEIYGMKY